MSGELLSTCELDAFNFGEGFGASDLERRKVGSESAQAAEA
jgi:hypothetical protein